MGKSERGLSYSQKVTDRGYLFILARIRTHTSTTEIVKIIKHTVHTSPFSSFILLRELPTEELSLVNGGSLHRHYHQRILSQCEVTCCYMTQILLAVRLFK